MGDDEQTDEKRNYILSSSQYCFVFDIEKNVE